MTFVAVIPMVFGVLIGAGGLLAWRERLAFDRGAGVRTAATLRSEEAFRVGNKVAGLPTLAGGVVAVAAGAAALAMPSGTGTVVAVLIGIVGGTLLLGAGAVLGNRAAEAVPEPEPAGCKGCACGSACLSRA
ncbi:SdpI family protein [Amycolatopsis suaedae]|uniref:SdpI family protein n=1 Tax=Amycolatopsis suaedae TaxID=2510978 RepID=A0A4Q7JD88_9PSEU|nr:SdpI family protein [Amycolatopsis suaedae]RZQ65032.1 SdpI family protein [Amycolatopsis suaedae]